MMTVRLCSRPAVFTTDVFTTDRGTIAIQGYPVNRATPEGEVVVEIPAWVFLEAARALGH